MPAKSHKNIILSSDGTGNAGGHKYDSNVWRLHTALEKQSHKKKLERIKQVAYYHDGVGTDENKILKIIGGAIGFGLDRIILELYIFLVNNYESGDKIYLFGFSRGSYTVRILAGMITTLGVIDKENYTKKSDQDLRKDVKSLLKTYKKFQRAKKINPQENIDNTIFKTHSNSKEVGFLGVWDTVDAYGIPSDLLAKIFDKLFYTSFRYHDRTLSTNVLVARHALALDDQRRIFLPVLWDETGGEDHKRIQQVWFSGTHSNVGGGYPKQGLAWTSLEWMMQEAQETGLFFDKGDTRQFTENKDAHDRLYDSRSGLSSYYAYKLRDVWPLVNAVSEVQTDKMGPREVMPRIHISVFDRIMQRTQAYSPTNIPHKFEIIGAEDDEETVRSFVDTYLSLDRKKHPDYVEERAPGLLSFVKKHVFKALSFIRRYSAYITFWSQLGVVAIFAKHTSRYDFTWDTLGTAILTSVGIWATVFLCVRIVQNRENRLYSTFWRKLIG